MYKEGLLIQHPAEIANDLKTYRFFQNFPAEILMQIATLAQVQKFPAEAVILNQGQQNELLYFMNSGEVDVLVEGELVTKLTQRGEVLGEMSVISAETVSATVKAKTEVECYVISAKDFSFVAARDQDRFQFLLNKIYSSILVDRLRTTNQKAKNFEIANRELVKAQSELQQISLQNRDRVAEILKDLDVNYLELIEKSIQQDDHAKSQLLVQNMRPIFSKLRHHFEKEKAISAKKVLLVDPEKKQQIVAKMALGGAGVDLRMANDLESAQQILQAEPIDLLMCDVKLTDVFEEVKKNYSKMSMVAFTSQALENEMTFLQKIPYVHHVISRNLEDRAFTVKSYVTTVTKILEDDFFGLEKYLSWGSEVNELKIAKSDVRTEIIDKMQTDLKKIGVRSSILDRCATVSEELLMNAIYDAPTDSSGKHLFNHRARTETIELAPNQESRYRFACDGNLVAISVVDPFGSLPRKVIFDYLESCYAGQAGSLNTGKGGAGRGLHQIVENSDLTIFNIQAGMRTEVICLFHIDLANKENQARPTFHAFFV